MSLQLEMRCDCVLMWFPSRYYFCAALRNHSMSLQIKMRCDWGLMWYPSRYIPPAAEHSMSLQLFLNCGCSGLLKCIEWFGEVRAKLYRDALWPWFDVVSISIHSACGGTLDVLATVIRSRTFWFAKGHRVIWWGTSQIVSRCAVIEVWGGFHLDTFRLRRNTRCPCNSRCAVFLLTPHFELQY